MISRTDIGSIPFFHQIIKQDRDQAQREPKSKTPAALSNINKTDVLKKPPSVINVGETARQPEDAEVKETQSLDEPFRYDGYADVDLYNRPDAGSQIVERLTPGDKFRIIYQKNEWVVLRLADDRLGWVLQKAIPSTQFAAPLEVPITQTNPESEFVPTPPPAPLTKENTVILKVDKGRVRELPSFQSDIIFRINKNEPASVIQTSGDWLFIRLKDGRRGWSHRTLFSWPPPDVSS